MVPTPLGIAKKQGYPKCAEVIRLIVVINLIVAIISALVRA
jgi:hypothetical protein